MAYDSDPDEATPLVSSVNVSISKEDEKNSQDTYFTSLKKSGKRLDNSNLVHKYFASIIKYTDVCSSKL